MSFFHHLIAKQVRFPNGFWGKFAGRRMTQQNRGLIDWSLELLDIQPSDHVLEIGFGPGYSIMKASELAFEGLIAGIELSETMLEEASKLNAAVIDSGEVDLRLGDACSLPYEDYLFDKAYAINVLYFWEDPMTPLNEINRVIKPGGRVLLGIIDKEDFAREKITQTGEFSLYSGAEAVNLMTDAGFSQARFEERDVHDTGMGICVIAQK